MGKEMNRTAVRDEILESVRKFLETKYDTWCEEIGSGKIIMPAVDKDGEEFYFKFEAVIPRGTRSGGTYMPYDGDAAVKEWRETKQIKAEEKAAKQAEKERKEREKQRLRDAKKEQSFMKKNLKELKSIKEKKKEED